MLHPELPRPGDMIVDFPEGWMSFSKRPGKNTPQCYTKPLDSLKNWNNHFFWVDECVFPTVVEWRSNASKDGMPAHGTYSVEAVRVLDMHHTPIQKQPEMLLCLVGISRRYYLGEEVYPTFHYDDDREIDLFSLIRAPNPTKVKTGSRPRAPHELPLLTLTAPLVIEMDEPASATDSSGVSSAIKRSQLEFAHESEASGRETAAPEMPPPEEVVMGSQLRLRFKQEAKLLRKSVAQVACREQRIQARKLKIKNLEALLETEAGMKRAAEEKSAGLSQELERMRAQFLELQVSNERLTQQVYALQQQVSGEEALKATFEDYKRQQDQMVERRCAEIDARLDAMSIDFDEELYPHMLTGRRWVIGHGLRLAMMKCVKSLEMRQAYADVVFAGIAKGMSEGLKHEVEHGHAQRTLEGLKDAPMDVIMASLYLEDDARENAPQFIRDLRPSSSQLTIPVYPKVRDPRNTWACKEEIKLADAIAANISRAEQKKRSRIVCRTHGVGSAHHARSDRVPVSAPIVVPQGLALLLVDAATQTKLDDA
nr:transposase (putative), gypsy type [Tanacetum cinerariifolium]